MVNKRADIDLLFRNGLKDYEVLPPVEAWNNIFPVIRKKQRPVILLRNAAMITVLLSLSFLTYRWSSEISTPFRNQGMAVRDESFRAADTQAGSGNTGIIPVTGRNIPETAQNDLMKELSPVDESAGNISSNETGSGFINGRINLIADNNLMTPAFINPRGGINYAIDNSSIDFAGLAGNDYTELKEKVDRWSVTAMASPTYYMRPELISNDISNQINSSEQSRISYSGGVSFAYKISRKLSIQSGLYYSSIGNEVGGINSFAGFREYDYTKGDHNFEVLTSSGRIYTHNSDVFLFDNSGDRVLTRYTNDVFDPAKANLSYMNNSLFQNFSYIEMPLILRYKLIDKSIDLNLIGGLSYNLLVNNSVHTVINGSRYDIGKTAGLNPFLVSSSMGMGIEYSLSDKFSLNLEPTFRYYLNTLGEIHGVRVHPYSFGVFSGLSYRF